MTEEALPAAEDVMEAHLTACINESLAAFMHDNACFLCERLVASSPSPVSAPISFSVLPPICITVHPAPGSGHASEQCDVSELQFPLPLTQYRLAATASTRGQACFNMAVVKLAA